MDSHNMTVDKATSVLGKMGILVYPINENNYHVYDDVLLTSRVYTKDELLELARQFADTESDDE